MAEEIRKQGHRFDEVVAYHDEALEPAERAELEAHLKSCAECQADLAASKRVLAAVDDRLASPLPADSRSTDEILAMMSKRTAELERGAPEARTPWWLWLVAGAAVAGAVTYTILTRQPTLEELEHQMHAAPPRPK